MAGFIQKVTKSFQNKNVSEFLKDLSSLGLGYKDQVIKNSIAVGYTQNMLTNGMPFLNTEDDYQMFLALSVPDISLRKNIAFFDVAYRQKRDQLRAVAMQDEIEDILNTITDEAIVYDTQNYFAKANTVNIPLENKEEIQAALDRNFKKVYRYFGFLDDNSAWSYFYRWLVDGYLAFEIIYDDTEKNIIGFKEIDVITLEPGIEKGTNRQIWYQFKDQGDREKMLYDTQIIYISYSTINSPSRISYTERLIRPFNILRIMEQTRLIWAVVNSSFKTKFVIPVGGKSKNRAKQSLGQLMQRYNEDISFNDDDGAISVQGKPFLPFMKQFWFPSKDGESPTIESIGNDGPDLNDTEALNYFYDKLKLVSKIPFSRFERRDSPTIDVTGEALARDERKFGRFVDRLRSVFAEILVKPLWIQMCLDFPELSEDEEFESQIAIEYVKDDYFEEIKDMEILQKKLDFVQNLAGLQSADGTTPYFNIEFLMKKHKLYSQEDLDTNNDLQRKEREEAAKLGTF